MKSQGENESNSYIKSSAQFGMVCVCVCVGGGRGNTGTHLISVFAFYIWLEQAYTTCMMVFRCFNY